MGSKFPVGKILGLAIALPFLFTLAIVILIVVILGSGPTTEKNLGHTLAYLTVINNNAKAHGVPPLWMISVIAHESGGNWLATNSNSNGTIDAGLSQINSVNWDTYGLTDDPYEVNKNLSTSATILGKNLKMYQANIENALYAYNGGTAENGKNYNPDYVPKVSYFYQQLTNEPLLASVYNFQGNTINLLVGEASYTTKDMVKEQTGEINPQMITVKVKGKEGTYGPVNISLQSGRNIGLPKESVIYSMTTSGFTPEVGDVISIASNSGGSTQITLTDPSSIGTVNLNASGYSWPVPGFKYISSSFGWRIHPVTHLSSYHDGIDIPAPIGCSVIAAKDGKVEITEYNNSVYGYYIYLLHEDGTRTFYGHLNSIKVMMGWSVKAGDEIATVGTRGMSTGPHLHFGVKVKDKFVDPSLYVRP